MITVSLLSLSPETMRRMHDHEVASETACRPWERRVALLVVFCCALGAVGAAWLSMH